MRSSASLRTKLLISLTSLLLSLGSLELGLRLAGRHYLGQTALPEDRVDLSPDVHRVLCVGDSFTFGGRTDRHGTYPALLEGELARQSSERFQVINSGVCEYNTRQVLTFLPQWLELYQPEVVLVLVGASNRFNPWGYAWGEQAGPLVGLRDAIMGLRVAKMARFIALELGGRVGSWRGSYVHYDGSPRSMGLDGRVEGHNPYIEAKHWIKQRAGTSRPSADPVETGWYHHAQGDNLRAIEHVEAVIEAGAEAEGLLCAAGYFRYRQGDLEAADAHYQRALQAYPDSAFVRGQAAFFFSNVGRDALLGGQPDQAIRWLFEAMPYIPDDEYVYYAMSKAYGLQSVWTAEAIARRTRELAELHPAMGANPKVRNHITMFENAEAWDQAVELWLEEDLDRIVELVESRGARVVLQSYPVPYDLANTQIAAAAQRHDVPLVDHTSRFEALLSEEPSDRYLFDDDHCTVEGHRVMARSLVPALLGEAR